MRIRFACLMFSCALLAVAASAQIFDFTHSQITGDTATVTFSSPRMFAPAAITGAPFTADRVSEHTQTLADGTHIHQPAHTEHISRDSQGRTRTERPVIGGMFGNQNAGDFRVTEIVDPVAGFAYLLDDQNEVAHRVALPAALERRPVVAPATRLATGAPVLVGQMGGFVGVGGGGGGGGVVRTGTPAGDSIRPQANVEKLEAKNIEGVIAQGTRRTMTWPIESQGNDRPMVETNETWMSAELKEIVLSKNNSPRNGENTIRLINISRAEPDATLFLPPPDYSIVDDKDSIKMTLKRR